MALVTTAVQDVVDTAPEPLGRACSWLGPKEGIFWSKEEIAGFLQLSQGGNELFYLLYFAYFTPLVREFGATLRDELFWQTGRCMSMCVFNCI